MKRYIKVLCVLSILGAGSFLKAAPRRSEESRRFEEHLKDVFSKEKVHRQQEEYKKRLEDHRRQVAKQNAEKSYQPEEQYKRNMEERGEQPATNRENLRREFVNNFGGKEEKEAQQKNTENVEQEEEKNIDFDDLLQENESNNKLPEPGKWELRWKRFKVGARDLFSFFSSNESLAKAHAELATLEAAAGNAKRALQHMREVGTYSSKHLEDVANTIIDTSEEDLQTLQNMIDTARQKGMKHMSDMYGILREAFRTKSVDIPGIKDPEAYFTRLGVEAKVIDGFAQKKVKVESFGFNESTENILRGIGENNNIHVDYLDQLKKLENRLFGKQETPGVEQKKASSQKEEPVQQDREKITSNEEDQKFEKNPSESQLSQEQVEQLQQALRQEQIELRTSAQKAFQDIKERGAQQLQTGSIPIVGKDGMTFYKVLEITPKNSDVKKGFRKRAREVSPDKWQITNGKYSADVQKIADSFNIPHDGATFTRANIEEVFKIANQAKDTLLKKQEMYDRYVGELTATRKTFANVENQLRSVHNRLEAGKQAGNVSENDIKKSVNTITTLGRDLQGNMRAKGLQHTDGNLAASMQKWGQRFTSSLQNAAKK